MKKVLFTLVILLIVAIGAFAPKKAAASHAAGGEILYEHITGNTYRIIFKFYRDCSGIAEPTTQQVCYYNTCNSLTGSLTLQKVQGNITGPNGPVPNGSETGDYCPGFASTCNGGSLPGFREWWYVDTVTLPSQCNYWTFATSIGSRNGGINIPAANFWVDARLDNMNAQVNSSPYFTVKPSAFVCMNAPYTFNNGAVDVNGDSLSFEIIQPQTGNCTGPSTDIAFNPGTPPYNITTNPIQTNNSFTFSPVTGQMSFTATQQGAFTLAVRVNEWRNGQKIGHVVRDIQFQVMPCNSLQPAISTVSTTLNGGQMQNGTIYGCANTPLSFCVDLTSPDTGSKLIIQDNHAAAAPGSVVTYSTMQTDSVRGCFSWIPTALDTGNKILVFTVRDSNCSSGGIIVSQTFTVPIYIAPVTMILSDTTICPGDSALLTAVGGSNFSWSVLPGGSPLTTLSCTNCKSPVAKPLVTTQYVVQSNNLSYCNKDKDTVTITVPTVPDFDLGPDITTCVNNQTQLNINLVPAAGTQYSVKWTPATYLNNDTLETPIMDPFNDITYYVEVTPSGLQRCSARDTLNVTVLQGFDILNGDTAICEGSSITINASASSDPRYTYDWMPTIGVSNSAILNPQITPDTSRIYTVTASYPGCKDTVNSFYVDVQPVPTVFIGPDRILCFGDTIHYDIAEVSPASYPYYTYNWSPGGNFSDATVLHPVYTAVAPSTITLTVTTPVGCEGSDDAFIDAVPADFIDVTSDAGAICPGDSTQLHVTGTYLDFVWYPNRYISDTLATDPYVYPKTTSTYTVVARSPELCIDSASVLLTVQPEAVLSLPDSVTIYPGEEYQLDPKTNCLYFQWFPPIGLNSSIISNPIAKPSVDTRYRITAATESGCIVVDSIDIFVSPDSYLDMPNVFMPGTVNGLFKASRRGIATLKSFIVYNRWGQKMFETSDIDAGWDGTLNGEGQPAGVYIYTVDAITPAGKRFTKQGNVTLLR